MRVGKVNHRRIVGHSTSAVLFVGLRHKLIAVKLANHILSMCSPELLIVFPKCVCH